MKSSKILIVVGLVVAGVIAYEFYKHYRSLKDTHEADTQDEDNILSKRNTDLPVDSATKPASDIYETKNAVVASVKERHYEAAKVTEESLNTIFKEKDEEHIVSENSDTLNQTRGALDELLK